MESAKELIAGLERRLKQLENDQVAQFEEFARQNEKLDELSANVQSLMKSTNGIVSLWSESVTAFKFFNRLMLAVRWFVKIVLAPFLLLGLLWRFAFNGIDFKTVIELLK